MIIFAIVISILVLVDLVVTFFFIKALLRLEERLSNLESSTIEQQSSKFEKSNIEIEDSVSSGLVKGLKAMRDEDERHLKLLEMARNAKNMPLKVMNQNSATPNTFDTGGDLIPSNLTKEEQEVLKMFYDRRNEK